MDFTGKTLGKYKLTERLGSGGMAEVYKAFQSGVERDVAVKVMHPHLADSADFRERFHREAKAIGQLQHPNIVHVIDFDGTGNDYYMVMEYLQGGTLRDYLAENKDLSVSESLSIIGHLCDALSYAHKRGMVHRDIKPGNVMFSDTAHTRVILTDFGMAYLKNESKLTVSGTLLGTPAYMPPEVVKGEPADHRADLYSLGAMLYEMVTGRTPHVADTPYGVLIKQANEPLPMPSEFKPDIDPALEAFLLKALAKDPDDRFADAQEMLDAIGVLDGTGTTTMARPVVTSQTMTDPEPISPNEGKDNTRLIVVGVLGGVVVIALLAWLIFGRGTNDETAVIPPAATETTVVAAVVQETTTVEPVLEPTLIPEIVAEEPTVEEPTAVPTEPPVVDPTIEPTSEPIEIIPTVDIAAQSFSVHDINFSDQDGLPASLVSLSVARLPLPAAEREHVAWLIGENAPQRLGVLPSRADSGEFSAVVDGNVITDFNSFVISSEPIGAASELTGEIVYEKVLPDSFLTPMRGLLGENMVNGNGQISLAQDHTGFLQGELANGNLQSARNHAEHVVNILDGVDGDDFGDLNGDGAAQNPGDDIGVRVYLELALAAANEARETLPLTRFSGAASEKTVMSLENSQSLRTAAQAVALKLFAVDSVEEAQPFADELEALLLQVQNGSDNDGNGVVDGLAGEGGTTAVYNNGLNWLASSYVAENGTTSSETNSAGMLHFSDDALLLTIDDVMLPPAETTYHAWLLNESSEEITSLGSLPVTNNQIRVQFPGDRDAFAQNDQLLVSVETVPVGDEAVGTAVYIGSLSPETKNVITNLLAPETGMLDTITAQTNLATDHAQFMIDDLAAGNLENAKRHAEHMINILVGEDAPEFGDLDGNGFPENPGDGVGVRVYLQQADEQVASVDLDSVEREFYGALTVAALDNSLITVEELLNKAGKIIAADTAAEAQVTSEELDPQLDLLITGVDKDENGVVDSLAGEGGIQSLRELVTSLGHWAIVAP